MIHNKIVAAIVPIKNHSERVKNKNFRNFNGKPLYHHILQTLEKTYAIDKVIVDTDSDRVKSEAPVLFSKVSILERPEKLLGDFTSVNKIIEFDLENSDADVYLQSHATNPLLKAETISIALKKFVEFNGEYDSIFSVNKFQSRFYNWEGNPANHNPEELLRTQDLTPIYEENSNLYIFTKESFNRTKKRIGATPFMYCMSKVESIDIDDMFSFHLAELLSMYATKDL